ncbi:MAG: ParB/RepB/Spo0J family partition protein [Candidatus Jacksonbacteria bacterium]
MSIKYGLGRGLSSLIPDKAKYKILHAASAGEAKSRSDDQQANMHQVKEQVLFISSKQITANPYQPRNNFEQDKLTELAASIKVHGIINPLIVTLVSDDKYELISGERRLRAALDLGLDQVPAIVRSAGDLEKLELALIENIQREDLNSIELAHGYRKLIDEFSLTQKELAKKVGKSRPQVANTLRLLGLPQEIQESLIKEEISEGHAKVILSLPDQKGQLNLWKKITLNNLTVRITERELKHIKVKSHSRKVPVRDANLAALEERLEERFGTRAAIKGSMEKGQIIIDYFSRQELERIADRISNS